MSDNASSSAYLGVSQSLSGKVWRQRPTDDALAAEHARKLNSPDIVGRLLAAPALSGSYSPEQALQQLLAGTGITYKRKGNTISLTPDPASSVAELSTITVKGGILGDLSPAYAGGQVATGGSLGLLGSVDVMDNPFSTTNYTSELLYDQQARTLADVVVNDAAVRTTTSTGGFGEDFVIRGFAVGSGVACAPGLPIGSAAPGADQAEPAPAGRCAPPTGADAGNAAPGPVSTGAGGHCGRSSPA